MYFNKVHTYSYKVEFDDIDLTQVMHHPRYLVFLERARSESLATAQVMSFKEFLARGYCFAIAEVKMKYMKALKMGETFYVHSAITAFRKSSFRIRQIISLSEHTSLEYFGQDSLETSFTLYPEQEKPVYMADMRFVCVHKDTFTPTPLPEFFRETYLLKYVPSDKKLEDFEDVKIR
jgi:YbgC/YbaW family acyl-CoA thioester hydrolase